MEAKLNTSKRKSTEKEDVRPRGINNTFHCVQHFCRTTFSIGVWMMDCRHDASESSKRGNQKVSMRAVPELDLSRLTAYLKGDVTVF